MPSHFEFIHFTVLYVNTTEANGIREKESFGDGLSELKNISVWKTLNSLSTLDH